MRKLIYFLLFIVTLHACLSLPLYIHFEKFNLMDWQRRVFEWNYIGVFFNYILFVLFIVITKTKPREIGLHSGRWKETWLWYLLILSSVIMIPRCIDYFSKGGLFFSLPSLNTFFFQLIFVAIGEELVWRGVVQKQFGIWYSAVGFGLIHFLPSLANGGTFMNAISYGFFTFLLGLVFSWVRKKTDSLYPSILLHGLNNILNYLIK
ncbi:CPBP family intramembrane glutamic endopeptidase [Bacillus sp. S/N-304-OC-R1]|uniref:CPBP family intramembrane glutamic endopeptidase n=1 Tax=Bacillus sp. S/N-304-OC-R1 TaxID=2758034 RepID=UPI001C8EECDA|nr:CPBP family intramembrane glutamic endopeptidase [Bacillus sp. S/N-304-OC-R1]MBY0122822.1 CPBP family intramembrane metalloprotease [Bacillus sp. S/N-304-OC-R1]